MVSTPHPPPVIGKSGNLTVFVTPPVEPESPGSEFSTPPTSPRAEDSPESPPAPPASPPAPVYSISTPPLVKTVSPPLPAEKLSRPSPVQVPPPPVKTVSPPLPAEQLSHPPLVQAPPPPVKSVSTPLQAPMPPVQVPPLQFAKASAGSDGSPALAFFWDAVARVQEAHASLDEHISRWFGLDQSKYQWALNDYYERTGQKRGGSGALVQCRVSPLVSCGFGRTSLQNEIDLSNAGTRKEHSCKSLESMKK